MNCPVCKVGNMVKSGANSFCTGCNFIKFTMNDDYVEAACKLIATLLNNTEFKDHKAVSDTVVKTISMHLPMMANWLGTIVNGMENVLAAITNTALSHSINVIVGSDVMLCSCGYPNDAEGICAGNEALGCTAYFKMVDGKLISEFLCDCGSMDSFFKRTGTDLCACKQCSRLYIRNQVDGSFAEVG